jgi:hypothetical protein
MGLPTEDHKSTASKASSVTETTFGDTKKDGTPENHQTIIDPKSTTEGAIAAETPVATDTAPDAEDDIEYPHGVKLWSILSALCLAVFLVALDQTIISTAIPKITDHFNSIKDIGW